MASLQAQVDVVKTAVGAHSTCTPTTVVTLKKLLGLDSDANTKPTKPGHRATKSVSAARAKQDDGLSAKEKTALAAYVVNVTMKSLTEAAKQQRSSSAPPQEEDDASRRRLRRSMSQPLTPLPARTLNRTATSPNVVSKGPRSAAVSQSTKYTTTAECARVALASLRNAKGPITAGQTDFNVEDGMWTLAGKSIAIGLNELALKELRVLKKRLEKGTSAEPTTTDEAVCDLLNLQELVSTNSLATMASFQIQSLKLVAAWKKPTQIEGVLPWLRYSNKLSPSNVLQDLSKTDSAAASKAARQLASLSQTLLSLAPSVSSSEDSTACEPRLSPSPAAAFELQALAFRAQLDWWDIADHKSDTDRELLGPFSRCVRCFIRRAPADASTNSLLSTANNDITYRISRSSRPTASVSGSPKPNIIQCVAAAAYAAQEYAAACRDYDTVKVMWGNDIEGSISVCSVTARLIAAMLKRADRDEHDEKHMEDAIRVLNAPLSGTSAQVDELWESLSLARRSVAGMLMTNWGDKCTIALTLRSLLQKFLMRFPRFVTRWLGSVPDQDADAKHILRFDRRRQLIMPTASQILDGTFMVVKAEIARFATEFDVMDSVLQDCLSLLTALADPALPINKLEALGAYKVKISYLYSTVFNQVRKSAEQTKATRKLALQALSRSIDAVKECSNAEKEKAGLATKLEIMADMCKGSGRTEDASKTLRSICTSMVEQGVLEEVTILLASQPLQLAWASSAKALSLSRTLRSIAKLDDTWNDWTFFLPEAERAAVLEHLLQITTEDKTKNKPLQLHHPGMSALLRIYSADKYPIRRLRVLLKLYPHQLGQADQLREITNLLTQAMKYLQKKNLAEDAGLVQYMPHLQSYYASVLALGTLDGVFPATPVREAVSAWSTMVQSCSTAKETLAKIDEPEALLDHLVAVNHLAGMKGESNLQLSILELCLKLARTYAKPSNDQLAAYSCKLARQYIDVGLYTEASETLESMKSMIAEDGVSPETVSEFYLSRAGYFTGIDKTKEAMICLQKVNNQTSSGVKTQMTAIVALSSMTQSMLLLKSGDVPGALRGARYTVKSLSTEWHRCDGPSLQASASAKPTLAESVLGKAHPKAQSAPYGVHLWPLVRPLFDSLMHISTVYAHIGAFQETIHYCESAERVADGSQSSLFKAECSAWRALVYARAGRREDAMAPLDVAIANIPNEACAARIKLSQQVGNAYRELEEKERASEYYTMAVDATRQLANRGKPTEEQPKPAPTTTVAQEKTVTTRARAAPTSASVKRTRAVTVPARVSKRAATTKAKAAPAPATLVPTDTYQASLLASVLLSRARGALQFKDWQSVASALTMVKELPRFFDNARQEQLLTATKHISHSLEQMVKDPVFSVMHDSTISFPAILTSTETDKQLSTGQSPPRRGRANTAKSTKNETPSFVEALKQAQEVLLEAHASALATGDNATLQRISTLLQSTVISLTATSSAKIKTSIQCESTTVAVELARNAIWRREQLTNEAANSSAQIMRPQSEDTSVFGLLDQMAELGLTSDMARFQTDFVEVVPKTWNVISLSLSENQRDLCITKFQAGHSPFILRLPLERTNARDGESEVYNFEHGRDEMLEIIAGANRTSHSGAAVSATKAARSEWWAERTALDEQLKNLLMNIETTWLGGFRGIFSQHERRPDLLARFQKNFHQMLEQNLPSRSGGGRGKKKAPPSTVTLDPRILDLFIGLGDPTDASVDYDEALNDLLYFVVDILQFHGERNAYDEIDFDGMVIEVYDAMRGYYAEINADGGRQIGAHTVLVLDKALHAFPWESMPCLIGLPVSRVTSLAALSRLIAEAKAPVNAMTDGIEDERPGGHYVSAKSGTYFLNPSSDLKVTQEYFESSFSSLGTWTSHVDKAPEESAFETALSTSEILLYFGHGGGSQYIRGKTIRKLEKCKPAAFLMGCSSAALTEAGEFEPYGPVWNYITAGCPAVVGTLWDVTDRDIDRFAGKAFEEWGLFKRGTFKEDIKHRARMAPDVIDKTKEIGSLSEAVGRAREACRFKYLNAAAAVVYGIPVYIERDV